jgi:hypothetical protein
MFIGPVAAEAAEGAVAKPVAAAAADYLRRLHARFQQRHRDHRLEGGAGWIKATQRLVGERPPLVLRSIFHSFWLMPSEKLLGS